jgi:cytochrome c
MKLIWWVLGGVLAAASAQSADAQRGKALYETRCIACHSIDANRIGPAHRGVYGRKAGAAKGFDYSPALRTARVVWEARTLDLWLADPERLIPGQRMGYSVSEAADRADLIAYLRGE